MCVTYDEDTGWGRCVVTKVSSGLVSARASASPCLADARTWSDRGEARSGVLGVYGERGLRGRDESEAGGAVRASPAVRPTPGPAALLQPAWPPLRPRGCGRPAPIASERPWTLTSSACAPTALVRCVASTDHFICPITNDPNRKWTPMIETLMEHGGFGG